MVKYLSLKEEASCFNARPTPKAPQAATALPAAIGCSRTHPALVFGRKPHGIESMVRARTNASKSRMAAYLFLNEEVCAARSDQDNTSP